VLTSTSGMTTLYMAANVSKIMLFNFVQVQV